MKKGEIYEGVIEKVDFPNKGYVFVEDQKILIKNGIPGQKVRFMIQKKRSGRAQGRILEVMEKITIGDKRAGMQQFSSMWWLHVSDNVL